MADETLPKIEIYITTCERDRLKYESENIDFINDVVQAAGKRCGVTITPAKRKGGGDP